jgi:hypothetical protein
MRYAKQIVPVFLVTCLGIAQGCSKKDTAANALQQKSAQGVMSSAHGKMQQIPAALAVASPKDETEAATARTRVLSQVKNKEFSAIYKEASAGFREIGPEEQFIAQWNKQLLETGAFKESKEVSHLVRPSDKFIVYTYAVTYENKNKELRLTFGRSKNGKMELTGINQKEIK